MNDEFISGLANIACNTIEQVIMLADVTMCLTGTFENFKIWR